MKAIRHAAPFLAASAVALFVSACASSPSANAPDLSSTAWTATSINGAAVVGETAPRLQFGGEYRVFGSTGCNRFFGIYEQDGAALYLRGLASSRMACDEPVMAQETAYMAILGAANGFTATPGQSLVVQAADGRTVSFVSAAPEPEPASTAPAP